MPPHNPNACYAINNPPIPRATTSLSNSTNPSNINNQNNNISNGNGMAGGVQQQQQQQQKNPKLYKTELCRSWMEHGRCNYGERCQYAHGEREKRPVPRHPKYKTEACQSYHKTGYCPYGPRCHFIHNENPSQLKALIDQNEKALQMVQELAVIPINGSASEIPRKSLIVSSSSASLGNSPFGCVLQKNNSVHTFSNFHGQYLEKTQSNNALQQQQQQQLQQQQENCAQFFHFNNASQQNHQHNHHQQQLPIGMGLNLMGHSSNIVQYQQHQQQQQDITFFASPQQCSPENQNAQQSPLSSASYEMFGGISPKNQQQMTTTELFDHGEMSSPQPNNTHNQLHYHHQNFNHQQSRLAHPTSQPLSPFGKEQQHPQQQFGHNAQEWHLAKQMQEIYSNGKNGTNAAASGANNRSKNGNSELDPQNMLANLCSSDDDYSRSSLLSSTADSGTESPPMTLAFDDDTLTKSKGESKKLASPQLIGQITNLSDAESDAQNRRSSDGDTVKANLVISGPNKSADLRRHNHSTASSSLASLLSSSSSSNAHHHHLQLSSNGKSSATVPNAALAVSSKIRLPVFERLSLNQ
ncbi:hypothetical protein niasHT_004070 [Heterodera trifolii]|uniref:C3H1-type domain-containing protein n=1 Tax=Heterodera trifolii TaxID=157864 RepID=A0ABD2MBT7_9BILA